VTDRAGAAGNVPAGSHVGKVAVLRPSATTRLRWLAPAVAACLTLATCTPAPSPIPTAATPATTLGPSAVAATAGPSGAVADIPFADALRNAIDVDAITADLRELQSVTDAHGGARPAGSDGHDAAAQFVADQLRAAGFDVQLQPVDLPYFQQTGPSTLATIGTAARLFEDFHDFKAMLFSPSANVTAPIYALGFSPTAQPGSTGGLGCNPEDWLDVPPGVVVLVQPGNCRRHDVVVQAQVAGAVGIVTAYPAWTRDGVLRPTLIDPADIRIPAIGTTQAAGQALADAAAAGASVHVETQTSTETRSSMNVIGETPWGDPGHVVMLGGHLDSVVDGPGSNDNGSGTMTVLEIARELGATTGTGAAGDTGHTTGPAPAWKVRVAFWTGEEIGLWGSRAYVQSDSDRAAIQAYLNFDMLGSKNGVRLVYDGSATSRPTEGRTIAGLFSQAFDAAGLVWQSEALGGSSDHFSFDQAGIPTGGLFSGANERKTAAQAGLFGGDADAPDDACYHLACDTPDNIDAALLGDMARAAAWVTGALASAEVELSGQ
jgi:hypothetical protein